MTCGERIAELVECARRGDGSNAAELRLHLARCSQCRERWEAERRLTGQFGIIRSRTADLRSPESRREALMLEFSRKHRRKPVQSWVWALGAAAALLLAVVSFQAKWTYDVRTGETVLNEASSFFSADASALSSDDFIAVPWTPPLAPGEMVRMVRADMRPEALASMGVEVNPLWAGELPVDVVVGEDGLPRAVRIADSSQF
jgi:predicted anti-sigma-YlaC factor YlaD